jgi:hypothetical protein
MCTIIESFYQFLLGINETDKPNVKAYQFVFKKMNRVNICYNVDSANAFYNRIRNKLIHQNKTNIDAALCDGGNPVSFSTNNVFLCHPRAFYNDIKSIVIEYFNDLHHTNEQELSRFITKIDSIIN